MIQESISLELTPDNPYSSGVIYEFEDGTLSLELGVNEFKDKEFNFIYHEVIAGNTWDMLAFEYYQNSKLWHKICSANPQYNSLENPIPGTKIKIPELD